jgi:hypothetical protein
MEKAHVISCSDYLQLGKAILQKVNVSEEHAEILMENFRDCDEKGIFTHGIYRLPTYIKQIQRGNINAQPSIRKIKEDSLVKLIEGDAGLGAVVSYYAMKEAVIRLPWILQTVLLPEVRYELPMRKGSLSRWGGQSINLASLRLARKRLWMAGRFCRSAIIKDMELR